MKIESNNRPQSANFVARKISSGRDNKTTKTLPQNDLPFTISNSETRNQQYAKNSSEKNSSPKISQEIKDDFNQNIDDSLINPKIDNLSCVDGHNKISQNINEKAEEVKSSQRHQRDFSRDQRRNHEYKLKNNNQRHNHRDVHQRSGDKNFLQEEVKIANKKNFLENLILKIKAIFGIKTANKESYQNFSQNSKNRHGNSDNYYRRSRKNRRSNFKDRKKFYNKTA